MMDWQGHAGAGEWLALSLLTIAVVIIAVGVVVALTRSTHAPRHAASRQPDAEADNARRPG